MSFRRALAVPPGAAPLWANRLLAAVLLLALAGAGPLWAYPPVYTVRKAVHLGDLAAAGRLPLTVTGLSASGQMAGYFTNTVGSKGSYQTVVQAFTWDDATQTLTNLGGPLGAAASMATCVNASGTVAGVSWSDNGITQQAGFVWQNGAATVFSSPAEDGNIDTVTGLNSAGQVIGTYFGSSGYKRAFLWDGAASTDLGDLGDPAHSTVWPQAVNDAGQVTGTVYNPNAGGGGSTATAFQWQAGAMGTLPGTGGYAGTSAVGLSAAGEIIGTYTAASGSAVSGGFYWFNQMVMDLGSLGGGGTVPFAFSGSGVTGTGYAANNTLHLFGWLGGPLNDLGLADLSPGDTAFQLTSVNAAGECGGLVTDAGGNTQAFVWTGGSFYNLAAVLRPAGSGFRADGSDGSRVILNDALQLACSGYDAQGLPVALLLTADADGNGLPDGWELFYFGHTGVDPNAQAAGSGLTYLQKYQLRLDPTVASTSGDGVTDGWKVAHGADPRADASTARDGVPDQWKAQYGYSLTENMADRDDDADGLTNREEFLAGTDPHNPDTDNDKVPDGQDGGPLDPLLRQPRVAETKYAVIDLGAGGSGQINDLGQVLYGADDAASGRTNSCLWQNGTSVSLGFGARAMNNSGVVVGQMQGTHPGTIGPAIGWQPGDTDYPAGGYPVRWVNGQIEDLTEYFPVFYPNHPRGYFMGEWAADVLSTGEIWGEAQSQHLAMTSGNLFSSYVDVPTDAKPNRGTSFVDFSHDQYFSDAVKIDPLYHEVAEPGTPAQNVGTPSCHSDLRSVYHTVFVSNKARYDPDQVRDSTYSSSWIDLCGAKLCVDPVPAAGTMPYAMQFPAEVPGMAATWDVPAVLIRNYNQQAVAPAMAVLRDGRWQRVQLKDADKAIPDCFTTALNNRGEILLNSGNSDGSAEQASIWHNGHVDSLDDLIGQPDAWHIARGVDINNNGWIVATGYDPRLGSAAPSHALLLVPVDISITVGYGPSGVSRTNVDQAIAALPGLISTDTHGDITTYSFNGKDKAGKSKVWTVQTSTNQDSFISALKLVPYVAYVGHANMGAGFGLKAHANDPPFDPASVRHLHDFMNLRNPQAAINWPFLNQVEYANFGAQAIASSEIPAKVQNYQVTGFPLVDSDGNPNNLRYPNEQSIGDGGTFKLTGNGMNRHHMTREANPFLVVNTPSMSLPKLGYRIFLASACASARDYSDAFKHGCFIGSLDVTSALPEVPKHFVSALIAGGEANEILAEFASDPLRITDYAQKNF